MKISLWRIIIPLFIANGIGIMLRLYNLDSYIILLGFRLHISCLVPFLFILPDGLSELKRELIKPGYKRAVLFILIIFIPIIIVTGTGCLLKYITLGDPEYFYELGLSSIIDYPLYLIWNSINLIFLYLYLSALVKRGWNFILISIFTVLLFAFEFYTPKVDYILYLNIAFLIIISVVSTILIKSLKNIYWYVITIFSILCSVILLYGSSSKIIVNLLLASTYNKWEGLLEVKKPFDEYVIGVILFLGLIISVITALVRRKKVQTP